MNRFAIPLGVFGLLVIIFGVTLWRTPETPVVTSALIGKPAPIFTLPDLLQPGSTVTNESFKGRWYLINVWGTWCVACRQEHGVLLEIQREGKVAVLGLDYPGDEPNEDVKARQWLQELGNPYEAVAYDHEGRVGIDYGVYGAPENFLVNPQGIIVKKWFGLTTESWNAGRKEFLEGAGK